MAKIYKSFQIKIDKENPQRIPTTHPKPRAMVREEPEEEELPPGLFQELSPSGLTAGKKVTIDDDATPPRDADKPRASGGDDEPLDETVSKKPSWGSRLAQMLAELNRRQAELAQQEAKLGDWERALMEREKYIETEEQRIHNEGMTKRKNIEEETAKIIEMAKKSADNIFKTANAEADTVRKTLKLEVEEARNKAHKEGFALGEEKGIAAGEKSGLDEGRMEWRSLIQETEALITELQTSRMGILKASEEEVLKLVLAFAKKVLRSECLSRPEIILNSIDAAINKISEVDKIVVRINLRDKSMAESKKSEFMKHLSGMGELRIIEDSALTPGGLKIETGVGSIDATIESQAEELEKNLLKSLKRAD
jgi:flagellar assembly protein FliH